MGMFKSSKKSFHMRFADGQVRTIKDMKPNPQTGMVELVIKSGLRSVKSIMLPEKAILGQNRYVMSGNAYCYCCHTFTSEGNPVIQGADDVTKMALEIMEMDQIIQTLRDINMTMRADIHSMLKTREDITESIANDLKKIAQAAYTPRKFPTHVPETPYDPEGGPEFDPTRR